MKTLVVCAAFNKDVIVLRLCLNKVYESSASTFAISNGNRTERSPIQSVIIRVITKSDDRAAGARFVYDEYDYRLNWTTRSPIIS